MHKQVIREVTPDSIAEEVGIEPFDELISINEKPVRDVLDYRYLIQEEELNVIIKKSNGDLWELEIEKEEDEDLGLNFCDGLMDEYQSCRNKCIFCFIDQLPRGMRETLYFKDDDARLSFLQGNYVTLTNMSKEDLDRICFYKLSPINISVHTTNPELRCSMLNNRFAGDVLIKMKQLADAGIVMNTQVVLCKDFNDKKELDRTIADLEQLIPAVLSLSVVPFGMSAHRNGLTPIAPFTKADACSVVKQISLWQEHMLYAHGSRFVYAADEFYLKAELPLPAEEEYEEYPQLENGVGMLRSLINETEDALLIAKEEHQEHPIITDDRRVISIATGEAAAPTIRMLTEKITTAFPQINATVYTIKNLFFGENITVAGLLTGQDIISQLEGKRLGDELLLPEELLRDGENVLLDNIRINEIESALQTKIRIVQSCGTTFLNAVLNRRNDE